MSDGPTDEQRRSRLELYHAHAVIEKAIAGMPVSDAVKSELRILYTAAFRMSVLHNDGILSQRVLLPW